MDGLRISLTRRKWLALLLAMIEGPQGTERFWSVQGMPKLLFRLDGLLMAGVHCFDSTFYKNKTMGWSPGGSVFDRYGKIDFLSK
ncbi:hypothetical protein RCF34_02910 [Pseudomonas sp. 102515]|uniref:hypothetical protein n=1 Tax=Pseudomonas sp. 102515 TaxID=3071568 RepID=UPI002802BFEE|nr:hypothetical protein [Pseudomonas sp. 102515]MDQ7912060.1 hypothetical protein [Pseudomonas sp. 102515]